MTIERKYLKHLTSLAWSAITGKPDFATVATSGSYNDLLNKPTIPSSTSDIAASLLAANGYIKFTNGLKIVWGVGSEFTIADNRNKTKTQSFHSSFTTCYWVMTCCKDTGVTGAGATSTYFANVTMHVKSFTSSSFTYITDTEGEGSNDKVACVYLAIGKA